MACIALFAISALCRPALAAAQAVAGAGSASAGPRTHLLVVSGLGGAPAFSRAFHAWGAALADAAVGRYGLAAEDVAFLAEDPARDPGRVDGASTKAEIERVLSGIAERAGPADRVLIVLFGHGSAADGESRFNLRGPDMGAADFAQLLDALGARRVALVNTASASGGFIERLSGPGRAILTATRSVREGNATMFGEFFAQALAGDGADGDKDGRVSLLEAFDYARREVERAYREENRLLTEHAVLDDNGDGAGSAEPGPRAEDGALAAAFYLGAAAGAPVAADASPELRALYTRRAELAGRIEALKAGKEAMDPARYQADLEALLIELARTDQAIRALEGGTP